MFLIPLLKLEASSSEQNHVLLFQQYLKYISMSRSASSASFFVVPSIFVIHFVNSAQILNDTCVSGVVVTVILAFTKM